MDDPRHPLDQSTYQVRLEWGAVGLARLAPADIVVIVDVLRFCIEVISAVEAGETYPLDAAAQRRLDQRRGGRRRSRGSGAVVLLGALRNAAAVARTVAAEQMRRGAGRASR